MRRCALFLAFCLLIPCLSAADATPSASAPVSDDPILKEAAAFGKKLEQSIVSGSTKVFDDALEFQTLFEAALKGVTVSAPMKQALTDAIMQRSFGKQMLALCAQGGTFRYVRCRMEKEQPMLLFRMAEKSGGFDYYQVFLKMGAPNGPRITDLYHCSVTEAYSETLRHCVLEATAQVPNRILSPDDLVFVHAAQVLEPFNTLLEAGKPGEALLGLQKLPPEVLHTKPAAALRAQAAKGIGGAVYAAAVMDLAAVLKDSPWVHLHLLDVEAMHEDYRSMLNSLDVLEKNTGGDPKLNFVRAYVFYKLENLAEAKTEIKKALDYDPYLGKDAYGLLFMCLIKDKSFGDIAAYLQKLEAIGTPMDFVATMPGFAEFRTSPEYKQWLARKPVSPTAPAPAK